MIELRSKCHGAKVKEVHAHNPIATQGGLDDYYECEECKTMCEISLVSDEFDVEEEGRALFAWSAVPHTIDECVSWIQYLINKLKGG